MTSFSLSDVLRHIITGAFFLLFIVAFLELFDIFSFRKLLVESEWFWIVILLICYPLGIVFQSLNKKAEKYYKYNSLQIAFFRFGVSEKKEDGKRHKNIFYYIFSRYSIKRMCYLMKKGRLENAPEWIQTATYPEKIVEYVEMEIENKKRANINEYFYFCEFFQGLHIASVFLFLPSLAALVSVFFIKWESKYWVIIIMFVVLMLILIFSHRLARFYAKLFILSLDAYKDVLDISIDKYMHKFGVQRVFITMRAKSNSDFFENAIRSVYEQDYYDINLVILEDSATPTLENRITSVSKNYKGKEKNIHLLYYHSLCGSPAAASYKIRNIILNVADREDDIIFILDDDDVLAHNHVVSDVVCQMNKRKADICLVKYDIIGSPEMNIARNGGSTHNNLTTKLYKEEFAFTIEQVPCFCFAATLGWSKIYRMDTLKKYFLMINATKEKLDKNRVNLNLKSYEDFPDILVFLIPGTRVTGLEQPAYLYRKHPKSATRKISKEAFQEWRIDQFRLLMNAVDLHSNKLIKGYEEFLDYYLLVKIFEIETILGKYKEEKILDDYSSDDFIKDMKKYNLYIDNAKRLYSFCCIKECIDREDGGKQFDACNFKYCLEKNKQSVNSTGKI